MFCLEYKISYNNSNLNIMAMKHYYLLFTALLLLSTNLSAQFVDDMEYPDGVPESSYWWGNCWGGGSGCPPLIAGPGAGHNSDYSGYIPGDLVTDVILDLGNRIFAQWGLEFWMYIPSDKEAYWNLQGEVPVGAGEWIVGNVFFNQDNLSPGVGVIDDTALGQINFDFPHDQWFKVVMNWDISKGINLATWQYNVDGVDVIPFGTPFTRYDGTYPTSLGGVNFFSISLDHELYIDDFNFINGFIDTEPNPIPVTDDMESYNEGEAIYEGWWGTWGCGDDLGCALESTSAQAYSGILSGLVPGDGTTSPDLDLGNKTSGEWALEFHMYIPQNKEGYFNLQGQIPIGAGEWIVGNIFFNKDLASPGIGHFDNSALGEVEFHFPHEEWFSIIMNIDLTNGMADATWEFMADGEIVLPAGTPFTDNSGDIPTSLGGISFFSISTNNEYYLDDLNYIEGVILGKNDIKDLNFSIYPNPAINSINISTTETIETIHIYSIQGILVKETTNNKTIDVSNLSSGIYFIEVTSGKRKSVQKMIKI